jgi:hypothetical protein
MWWFFSLEIQEHQEHLAIRAVQNLLYLLFLQANLASHPCQEDLSIHLFRQRQPPPVHLKINRKDVGNQNAHQCRELLHFLRSSPKVHVFVCVSTRSPHRSCVKCLCENGPVYVKRLREKYSKNFISTARSHLSHQSHFSLSGRSIKFSSLIFTSANQKWIVM